MKLWRKTTWKKAPNLDPPNWNFWGCCQRTLTSFSRCVFLMTLTEIKLSVALVLQHAVNLSPVAGGQQRPRPYFLHRTTTRLPHDPECSLKSKDILASKLRPSQVFGDQLKQLRFTEVNVSAIDWSIDISITVIDSLNREVPALKRAGNLIYQCPAVTSNHRLWFYFSR